MMLVGADFTWGFFTYKALKSHLHKHTQKGSCRVTHYWAGCSHPWPVGGESVNYVVFLNSYWSFSFKVSSCKSQRHPRLHSSRLLCLPYAPEHFNEVQKPQVRKDSWPGMPTAYVWSPRKALTENGALKTHSSFPSSQDAAVTHPISKKINLRLTFLHHMIPSW